MEPASPLPEATLPQRLPVMILRDCNLFPHCLLPLYIFESKYRQMLQDALAGDRMFCIGTVRPGASAAPSPGASIYEHSTAGLIRACVRRSDGASHLVLAGICRVRLTDLRYDRPYVTAAVEPLEDVSPPPGEIDPLCQLVRRLATRIAQSQENGGGQVLQYLTHLQDPSALADIVAFHFIQDVHRRQPLLALRDVQKRLTFALASLREPDGGMIA